MSRLSLKYHPDKNKGKGAQEKFEEINNGKNLYFYSVSILIKNLYMLMMCMRLSFI
jgi:curved DNA-binding protein CbpA